MLRVLRTRCARQHRSRLVGGGQVRCGVGPSLEIWRGWALTQQPQIPNW